MKKCSRQFFILFAFLKLSMPHTNAQTFNPLLATMLQDTLNTYFSAFSNMKGMTASVYLPGQGMWQSIVGVSYTGQPVTQSMEFGIASNSKLFTAVAILKLQENGVLNLNDHISMWLPGLNPSINPNITIRQLLNHTSGIPEVIFLSPWIDTVKNNPTRVFTPTEVVNWVTTSSFPAGTNWNYSNTNYILAGMIVKNATGFHISKVIRDNILSPLNLTSTFYDVEEPVIGTLAHRWWNGITGPSLVDYQPISRVGLNTAGGPAGSMFSTASDMAQWYKALFDGQVLNAASMAQLTTFVPTTSTTQQYGLGLFQETTQGQTYWGHSGDTWGYKSKMLYDTCRGTVVCGLSNSYPNGMTSIPFLLYRVVKNHIPSCPGIIAGLTSVTQGQNSVTYTTTPIANATSYVWTLPSGATGISSTNSISVNYGASALSGNITVRGNNSYGVGNVATYPINVTPAVLPVTLDFFKATLLENKRVELSWKTESERNCAYFSIERSDDGTNFNAIGTIKGNATSNQAHVYQFIDHHPYCSTAYYRLQQVDFSNEKQASNVLSATVACTERPMIYPNPADNFITVQCPNTNCSDWQVEIYSVLGKLLKTEFCIDNKAKINIENLNSDTYVVIFKGQAFSERQKLIVKRE